MRPKREADHSALYTARLYVYCTIFFHDNTYSLYSDIVIQFVLHQIRRQFVNNELECVWKEESVTSFEIHWQLPYGTVESSHSEKSRTRDLSHTKQSTLKARTVRCKGAGEKKGTAGHEEMTYVVRCKSFRPDQLL